MKRIMLFLGSQIVGSILSLIAILEKCGVSSFYLSYNVPLWGIILIVGILIILRYFFQKLIVLYFIKTYTFDSFGGSRIYTWQWQRTTSSCFNVYGYTPTNINVQKTTKLDPNMVVYDFAHCVTNKDLLQEYIMVSLYDKVENTKQTNLFLAQLHTLESHYSKQRIN